MDSESWQMNISIIMHLYSRAVVLVVTILMSFSMLKLADGIVILT